MASIRARLTIGYAAALIGTMAVFASALWIARRASVLRDLEERVVAQADQALFIIAQVKEAGEPITEVKDTLIGPVAAPRLRTMLEGVRGYLLVKDQRGRTLYSSSEVRQLPSDVSFILDTVGIQLPTNGVARQLRLADDAVLVTARDEPDASTGISRVVAGVSTSSVNSAPRELLGTMLVVAPLLLVLSVWGAYAIAGRAFRPVDRLIDQVEAITDGRSLHRRLAVGAAGDELGRLSATLNAMMGRLETSFGALRRFTADASHELKTPLTVLRADVERAMSPVTSETERLVYLEESLQETTRMADLVESLLTLARADEGRFDLHREIIEMEPLVREVYETATILGEAGGLRITSPVIDQATVLGDPTRLRQLFLNLVTNAIKYTPRGGSVEVTLSNNGESVSFAVRDTGIGIAAADLPYIFERFWRADRVRSRGSERAGFGLGLAISQWIAQAHGGTLTVVSRLTRGSTFTATIPLAPEPGVVTEERAASSSASDGDGTVGASG
jgi:signal transduction histidine kinase